MTFLWGSISVAAQTTTADKIAAAGKNRELERNAGAAAYCLASRTHRAGNIRLAVDNRGVIGDLDVEYPAGSRHVFGKMAIWIGGIRGDDTLVTTGLNTQDTYGSEFYPSICGAEERWSPAFADGNAPLGREAVSDQDITVYYADTLTDPAYIRSDPFDTRGHRPLGVEVQQNSYAWAAGSAASTVIIEFRIRNIGIAERVAGIRSTERLTGMFASIYGWSRVSYDLGANSTLGEDLLGFVGRAESPVQENRAELFNTVWEADADGDPEHNGWGRYSVPEALGISLLRGVSPSASCSYNWWAFSTAPQYDWGPVKRSSRVHFITGGLGHPTGDRSAYQVMSNGEVDYPQLEAAIDHQVRGWLPPPVDGARARDIADGEWVEFLLTTGPFDLAFDSTVSFAIAITGGRNFHELGSDFQEFMDPNHPAAFADRLDFTDLLRNVQWAKWTYDNPGVDTDRDGYAGEYYLQGFDTVYYRGDGVPDLRSALPPLPPRFEPSTAEGRMVLRWNGYRTETEKDIFTQRVDFEGYRVYISRTGRSDDWALLAQRDLINYARYTWDERRRRWRLLDPPYTLDSLRAMYDTISYRQYGFPFHPDSFAVPDTERAFMEEQLDPKDPSFLDTVYRYFGPYEANESPNDALLAEMAANGRRCNGYIRKVYPQVRPDSLSYRDDGTRYHPYYEYEYAIDGLQLAEPLFLAVSAFDNGDPGSDLQPLESPQGATAQEIWPINSVAIVKSEHPKPGVYPNPYRISDAYNAAGWENPRGLEPDPERARKVTFYNVPDTCVVSIWSLDGDLIRRLDHKSDPASSEASVVVWNLITRNTQAIKTGIYLYSIESRFGTDVGKLVIIK